jgi:signal peptidase I
MTAADMRRATVRFLGWVVTGMLAAALVAALAVIGTTTALRTHGVQVATVLSGSMTPAFRAGDAVIIQPAPAPEDLRVGQVITYHAPGEERLTTHRIHAIIDRPEGRFVQTKGDANPAPDANFTPASDVVGIMGRSIPNAGTAVAFYSQPRGRLIVLGIPLTVLLISQVMHLVGVMRRRDDEPGPDDTPPPPPPPPSSRRDRARRAGRTRLAKRGAAPTAVAAVAGTSALTSTGAVFAASTVGASSSFSAAADFCTGADRYASAVAADSPRLRWSHDSAASDQSGDVPAQATGTLAYGADGAIACSTSVSFTPSSALSAFAKTASGATFTIETWVRSTGSPAAQLVGLGDKRAAQGHSADHDRVLYLTSTGRAALSVQSGTARTTLTAPTSVTDGLWHHVVATYSPTTARLFIDGAIVASTTSPVQAVVASAYWRAGQDTLAGLPGASGSATLDGSLDETAIYDTALSAQQVAAHYAASGR